MKNSPQNATDPTGLRSVDPLDWAFGRRGLFGNAATYDGVYSWAVHSTADGLRATLGDAYLAQAGGWELIGVGLTGAAAGGVAGAFAAPAAAAYGFGAFGSAVLAGAAAGAAEYTGMVVAGNIGSAIAGRSAAPEFTAGGFASSALGGAIGGGVVHVGAVAGGALIRSGLGASRAALMRYPRIDPRNYTFSIDTSTLSMNGLGGLRAKFNAPQRIAGALSDSDLARIGQIRSQRRIGKTRNIAFAEGHVNGRDVGEVLGVSGRNTFGIQMPEQRMFRTSIDGHPRMFDAEVFVLERLAQSLDRNASGTIRLVSERAFCKSCTSVLDQFEQIFPNLRVIALQGR